MSIESELKNFRVELDAHVIAFDTHKAEQEKWNNEVLELIKTNQNTNELLTASIVKVEENTRPIVELVQDFQVLSRFADRLKKLMLLATLFGGTFAAVWQVFKDKF